MTYVFGNVVAELGKFPATGGESMLSSMMEVFNVAVLFLGCLYLVYISVYGQVSTAHHGQILGRAWSSVWVPIRSVIGLASLLPFVKGYSFLQCFVLWLAIQGVAAGNNLWEVMAEHMGTMGGFIAPPVTQDVHKLALASLAVYVRMAAQAEALQELGMSPTIRRRQVSLPEMGGFVI